MTTFLHCDNYATCNQTVRFYLDTKQTYERARAKGWHIWTGQTMGGRDRTVILCARCVGGHRALAPAPVRMPGDQEIIQIEAIIDGS